jgi:hypothetical protein
MVNNACKTWCVVVSSSCHVTYARRDLLVFGSGALSYSSDVRIVPFFFFRVGHFLSPLSLSEQFIFDVVSSTHRLFVCLFSDFSFLFSWPVILASSLLLLCDIVYMLFNLLLKFG